MKGPSAPAQRIKVFPEVLSREKAMSRVKADPEVYFKLSEKLGIVAK